MGSECKPECHPVCTAACSALSLCPAPAGGWEGSGLRGQRGLGTSPRCGAGLRGRRQGLGAQQPFGGTYGKKSWRLCWQ